jgi:hypothetical protein
VIVVTKSSQHVVDVYALASISSLVSSQSVPLFVLCHDEMGIVVS